MTRDLDNIHLYGIFARTRELYTLRKGHPLKPTFEGEQLANPLIPMRGAYFGAQRGGDAQLLSRLWWHTQEVPGEVNDRLSRGVRDCS